MNLFLAAVLTLAVLMILVGMWVYATEDTEDLED